MKKKKILTIVLSVLLAVVLLAGGSVGYLLSSLKPVDKERTLETADGKLKVGVISDLQLPDASGSKYEDHYRRALELFKAQGVNVIVNAGDFTDTATKAAYEVHKQIFDSVYSEAEREEIELSYILGNHDHWLPMFFDCFEIPFPHKMQSRFAKYTYAESPWTHKTVNGYHFIAISPENGDMGGDAYTEKVLAWAKEQIEAAVKDDPTKPIFVITHNNPADTVYMSGEGCQNLNALFAAYPQIISLSGHSHAPLMDEEAVYQKDYTAVNTQCTSYVCFEGGANALVQDDSAFIEDNPMVMIMELDGSKASLQRYSVLDGKAQKAPWVIDAAAGKDGFSYTDARKDAAEAPAWGDDFACTAKAEKTESGSAYCRLEFTAAKHADAVKNYRAVLKQGDKTVEFKLGEKTYTDLKLISDFALPAEQRGEKAVFCLWADRFETAIPAGAYTVELYAADAFGNESAPQTAQLAIAY